MADTSEQPTSYGTWPSPISADMVASAGIDFGHMALDGATLYWREQRPDEDGRGVVVSHDGEGRRDVTPPDGDVRALVNYGGGDFTVEDDTVFFAAAEDQRVYRHRVGGSPVAITPEPATERGLRYADFEVAPGADHLYCVREDHDAMDGPDGGAAEPVTTLVRLAVDGSESPRVVASGHDFYAAPRLSPGGDRLVWLTWDHPGMPWDSTEMHVADVDADGTLTDERVVMGGSGEAVFQPAWRPDGTLHAVSDRTGWWNLYRREGDEWLPYREEPAEYGVPHWLFGVATYAFLADDRVAVVVTRDGEESLELLSPNGTSERADLPYAVVGGDFLLPRLRSDGESVYLVGSGPHTPPRLVRWTPGTEPVILRYGSEMDVSEAYFSTPEHTTVPTRDGAETYAWVYEPVNPDVQPPADERPPLIVNAHGGPTGMVHPAFYPGIQFFTSRGFAVADVNYRGSAGYGRAYREAVYGEWGVVDVEDCIDVARHLATTGRVDGDRMAIRGSSAGGFITLAALAFNDAFAAGASTAGVSDLARLTEINPKFESSYLDNLVGAYPEMRDRYDARSPVHHAADIDDPLLLIQGEDDLVVPLSQAEAMVGALAAEDVPHALVVLEDDDHFLNRATSRRRRHEAELAFYGQVFGFEPDDELPAVDLASEGRA